MAVEERIQPLPQLEHPVGLLRIAVQVVVLVRVRLQVVEFVRRLVNALDVLLVVRPDRPHVLKLEVMDVVPRHRLSP